nr:ribonuclease H-like domain-containing protein [Tanacetum cinerariifolium]
MTDLGALNYFLGNSVTCESSGMFLSQKKHALELLDRAHLVNCNPTRTLFDTESKLGSDGDPIFDSTLYHSLAGGLQYLTFTRLNISYAVQQVCLHILKSLIWQLLKEYSDMFMAHWIWAPTLCIHYRSSDEVEYRGVANVVFETAWLCNLLRELHTPLLSAPLSIVTMFVFFMYHLVTSMLTFSPKDYRLCFLRNFVRV